MTELQTQVTAVVVFPDRARVTRRGTLSTEVGTHALELSELPLTLDPSSLRAMARGTASARLLSVNCHRVHHVETPAEKVRELEQQIEALQDEIAVLDTEVGMLQEERQTYHDLVSQTEVYARGLAFGKTDATAQMALFEQVRERVSKINARLQEESQKRRTLERQLAKLRQDISHMQGARGRDRFTATVEIEVAQAGELTLDVTYVVSGAAWTPLYDLRLLEEKEPPTLEVGYLAEVRQESGETWEDVQLTLSTARPALAGTAPELDPWYVGIRSTAPYPPPAPQQAILDYMTGGAVPEAEPQRRSARMRAETAPMEMDKAKVAEEVVATVEQAGAAVTYKVPGTVSIPDGGGPRKVTVARIALQPQMDYATAPKLVPAVYRHAVARNDSPYTLLSGEANLFAGDEFIGRTQLELTAPGGELELYLGVDDRIRVERELTRRDMDKHILRDRVRRDYGYEIILENLRAVDVRITVHDQIPLAKNEALKVKLESTAPPPTDQNRMGMLRWEMKLEPGAKKTLLFAFSVEHARSADVEGLP